MKTSIEKLFLLSTLIAGLGLLPAGRVTAQTFTTLYSFPATSTNSSGIYTNSDGASPSAGLILSGNTLYGAASGGGSSGVGTVFAINTNGTGFTNLHTFAGSPSEGRSPYGGLILSGNTLFGTTSSGGGSSNGTVFKVNTDGTGFTNVHSFTATPSEANSDGAYPYGRLVLSGNTLYGTAEIGGSSGNGTVFAVNTNGTSFTNLHSFTELSSDLNDDGASPTAGLILSGNALYGTAARGGNSGEGDGTVFAVNTDGTSFTNLHSFDSSSDGDSPYAGLVLSGNTLYGTTPAGGSLSFGTVFKVNTDGTGFTNLHDFAGFPSDGNTAYAGLILSGNTLYGTANEGGSANNGTVFAVNTDGTGFTNLHHFTATSGSPSTNSDGAAPRGDLILLGNTLYGTAEAGGSSGNGTVFSLLLPSPPQLIITLSGANVILTWPTNAAGYTLQSAPAITGTFTNILPAATSPHTNPITGAQKFYRLSQ